MRKRIGRKTSNPTLYLDTNILSVLFYRGAPVGTLHQQIKTREWWADERTFFTIYSTAGVRRSWSRPRRFRVRAWAKPFGEKSVKTITNATAELDEVERCRRVRRALEQKYRDLNGLCHWLLRIERQFRRTSSRKKRPLGSSSRKRKVAISK